MTQALARAFSTRMLPLALLAGVVLAAAPPVSYGLTAWQRLRSQAELDASSVAVRVRGTVERNPLLWRYNTPKVTQAAGLYGSEDELAQVRVLACDGAVILDRVRAKASSGGPAARAPVMVRGAVAAWVEVRMDPRSELRRLLAIALGSTLLGLAVGLVLFLYPTRVVRSQAKRLSETLGRLGAAEERLTEANRVLEGRVAAAVAEVRAISGRGRPGQEHARRRTARDLHDSVGQQLTALQIELSLSRERGPEGLARLEEAIRSCEGILAEIRRVVRDLRPVELEHNDAVEALAALAERFELRTKIATSFKVERGAEVAGEGVAVCLLRILQEALTNVSRHAGASEVGIVLAVRADAISLEIADDGQGFDDAARPSGSGLLGIRERCAMLGGTASIRSTPGEGTTVSVTLPNRAAAAA